MKTILKLIFSVIIAITVLTACVKDDTVHDFIPLEEVTISGLQEKYNFNYLEEVTITPEITTTIEDEGALEYRWYLFTEETQFSADTLSREKVMVADISATPGLEYKFVFSVKDTNTDIVYKKNMTAEVFGEFTAGIVLLCEQDGITDVNFVRPDETLLTSVFSRTNPEGTLGLNANRVFVVNPIPSRLQLKNIYLATNNAEGGYLLDPITMKIDKNLRDAFYENPYSETLELESYTKAGITDYLIMSGKIHNRLINLGDPQWRPELIITDTSIETDYYMHGQIVNRQGLGASVPVFHDNLNGRFLQHSPTNKGALSNYTGGTKDGFDYDDTNVEMLFTARTVLPIGFQGRYFYAVSRGKSDSRLYMMKFLIGRKSTIGRLEFHGDELVEISEAEFPGLYNATHFMADYSMPSILWYTDGDKLYALNVSAPDYTEIVIKDFAAEDMNIDAMKIYETTDDENNTITEIAMAVRNNSEANMPAGLIFYEASTVGGINISETRRLNNLADRIIDFDFKDN